MTTLNEIMSPKSIAIVGASDNKGRIGGRPLAHMIEQKFSGGIFKKSSGDGYLRPFELATYRLNNMIEILKNWNDYILDNKYLPQRGASFLLDDKEQIIYNYFSNDVLGYSPEMNNPLEFLYEKCR